MYKVLIVDDEQLIRSGMIARFQYLNFTFERIREAASGMEALALLEKEPADIVITDINMPRMDGFGFIEGMRADPNHKATPVLVLTTESDAAKKQRAREAGATGWIVKPFDPAKLVDAVRRVAA